MKALTVRQPWCWAIAGGMKTVENRSRGAQGWPAQNDVAVHAGLQWSHRGGNDDRVKDAWCDRHGLELVGKLDPRNTEFEFGVILALVDLVEVHPASPACVESICSPWGESSYESADGSTTWRVSHLLFENIRRLDVPVPCRGQLGLWTVPAEAARAVSAQCRAA